MILSSVYTKIFKYRYEVRLFHIFEKDFIQKVGLSWEFVIKVLDKSNWDDQAKKDSNRSLNPTPDTPHCSPGELTDTLLIQNNHWDFSNSSALALGTLWHMGLDTQLCPQVTLGKWEPVRGS